MDINKLTLATVETARITHDVRTILEFTGESTDRKISMNSITNGFEIDYSQMYDAPSLSFAILKKLSEYFGTEKIDVDDYSRSGCDTCDWGSKYGHTIQILEPTKNIPKLK